MARSVSFSNDKSLLEAALEGLELQKQRIEEQMQQVRAALGRKSGASKSAAFQVAPAAKRALSPAARKRIAAAQKRRWAEYRKSGKPKAE